MSNARLHPSLQVRPARTSQAEHRPTKQPTPHPSQHMLPPSGMTVRVVGVIERPRGIDLKLSVVTRNGDPVRLSIGVFREGVRIAFNEIPLADLVILEAAIAECRRVAAEQK